MSFSNLPPGISDSMIPGNRPEDLALDEFIDSILDDMDSIGLTTEDAKAIWNAGKTKFKCKTLKVVWGNWHHNFEVTSPATCADDVLVIHVSDASMNELLDADRD
jgi:hypothetical protein